MNGARTVHELCKGREREWLASREDERLHSPAAPHCDQPSDLLAIGRGVRRAVGTVQSRPRSGPSRPIALSASVGIHLAVVNAQCWATGRVGPYEDARLSTGTWGLDGGGHCRSHFVRARRDARRQRARVNVAFPDGSAATVSYPGEFDIACLARPVRSHRTTVA
jgi:hypothetical protein